MQAAQVIEEDQVNEIRQLIEDLNSGTEQFRMQQGRIVATYSEIIGSLDQTQEEYGETLKFFLQKLQKDMKPVLRVNTSLSDLLNTAIAFGGKATQTGRHVESLSKTITGIESDLITWSATTKEELKTFHQEAGKKFFRSMKFFILANTAGTISIFFIMFYFFYRTGMFNN